MHDFAFWFQIFFIFLQYYRYLIILFVMIIIIFSEIVSINAYCYFDHQFQSLMSGFNNGRLTALLNLSQKSSMLKTLLELYQNLSSHICKRQKGNRYDYTLYCIRACPLFWQTCNSAAIFCKETIFFTKWLIVEFSCLFSFESLFFLLFFTQPCMCKQVNSRLTGSHQLCMNLHSKNCGVKITPPVLIEDHTMHFTPVLNLWC